MFNISIFVLIFLMSTFGWAQTGNALVPNDLEIARYYSEVATFEEEVLDLPENELRRRHSEIKSRFNLGCAESAAKYGLLGLAVLYDLFLNTMSAVPGVDPRGWASRIKDRPFGTLADAKEQTNLDQTTCAILSKKRLLVAHKLRPAADELQQRGQWLFP